MYRKVYINISSIYIEKYISIYQIYQIVKNTLKCEKYMQKYMDSTPAKKNY